ncbi:MAG: hypothetical protein E5Y65_17830 [Mesorhizobium sp.]|uniref:hypothetical protein n=2 Tax=Mesorhizobium sp. TaxID=1871066 RepID=UPI000FE6490D|nr:hypothetical protein [Mesorhizobium sp.]RWB04242.1 MAG: hypothetical protein EOQ33_11750 [Mesorhizobium sp.]RWO05867.1 MAG: hypothetical protein EOS07_24040 [Mesorhizobium sp.]RWO33909.1 MAG: hypothetical protein EOS08_06210 [Mesorhizobium sp.]RWO57356.1 MAG: hypothetical protein EOS14_24195 [Mesorhizobium sp.]TIL28852.1 MAG: hypothetical protein E5Y85_30885 [Mesorhizobium sp.]
MRMDDEPADKKRAVSAAVRRFPQFELAIHRLMGRSEGFQDICEELAEAELALLRIDKVPPALRESRRAEWQELVDRLVGEVGAVLHADAARKPHFTPWPPRQN